MGRRAGQRCFGLGGGFADLDVEAEGLELAEVGADLAVAAGLLVVPAGPRVGEPCGGVGQEVPDDDEDGASGGALGFVPAQAAAEPNKGSRTRVRADRENPQPCAGVV